MSNPLYDREEKLKQQEIKKQNDPQNRAYKIIAESMKRVFNGPDGKIALRFILERCGFYDNSIVYNKMTGEINLNATVEKIHLRSLYLELRSFLDPEFLKGVEYSNPIQAELDK